MSSRLLPPLSPLPGHIISPDLPRISPHPSRSPTGLPISEIPSRLPFCPSTSSILTLIGTDSSAQPSESKLSNPLVVRYRADIIRFMTIERPDLRKDNHDLLRKVQVVWQEIEQGIMMPKVKVVSCQLHSDSSFPHPYLNFLSFESADTPNRSHLSIELLDRN